MTEKLRAYTVRLHAYPGDNSVQVRIKDLQHPDRKNIMFNLQRRRYGRLGLYYFNDRFSGEPYRTIAEAKEFALKIYRKGKR